MKRLFRSKAHAFILSCDFSAYSLARETGTTLSCQNLGQRLEVSTKKGTEKNKFDTNKFSGFKM